MPKVRGILEVIPGEFSVGKGNLLIENVLELVGYCPDLGNPYAYSFEGRNENGLTGVSTLGMEHYPTPDDALNGAIDDGFVPAWLGLIVISE